MPEGLGGGDAVNDGLAAVGIQPSALIWRHHNGSLGGVYPPHEALNGRRGELSADAFDGHIPREDLNGKYCMCLIQIEYRDSRGRFASGEQIGIEPTPQAVESTWENAREIGQLSYDEGYEPYVERLYDMDWPEGGSWDPHKAHNHYTGGGYLKKNEQIRGLRKMTKDTLEFMDSMDATITETLPQDTQLFRGLEVTEKFDPGKWRKGHVVHDPSFLSTSVGRDVAETFADYGGKGQGYVMEILAPKGTKHGYGLLYEKEYVLPRNTKLKVLSVTKPADGVAGVIRMVVL